MWCSVSFSNNFCYLGLQMTLTVTNSYYISVKYYIHSALFSIENSADYAFFYVALNFVGKQVNVKDIATLCVIISLC